MHKTPAWPASPWGSVQMRVYDWTLSGKLGWLLNRAEPEYASVPRFNYWTQEPYCGPVRLHARDGVQP